MHWDVCQMSLTEKCYFAKFPSLLFYRNRKTHWRKCYFTSVVNVVKSVISVICFFGSGTYTIRNLLRNFTLKISQLTQIWKEGEIPWAAIRLWVNITKDIHRTWCVDYGQIYGRIKWELTYLLTYTMVHSPSWEANWFAASQEIPRISRNPKIHYRTHKRPPPVSILGQPSPVHIPTSHLLEIRPNIIHPSTPRSPRWSLSVRFPHQDPTHPLLLTHSRHMSSPSHSSRFYHPHNIGWGVPII